MKKTTELFALEIAKSYPCHTLSQYHYMWQCAMWCRCESDIVLHIRLPLNKKIKGNFRSKFKTKQSRIQLLLTECDGLCSLQVGKPCLTGEALRRANIVNDEKAKRKFSAGLKSILTAPNRPLHLFNYTKQTFEGSFQWRTQKRVKRKCS